jgi:hypothetical protein
MRASVHQAAEGRPAKSRGVAPPLVTAVSWSARWWLLSLGEQKSADHGGKPLRFVRSESPALAAAGARSPTRASAPRACQSTDWRLAPRGCGLPFHRETRCRVNRIARAAPLRPNRQEGLPQRRLLLAQVRRPPRCAMATSRTHPLRRTAARACGDDPRLILGRRRAATPSIGSRGRCAGCSRSVTLRGDALSPVVTAQRVGGAVNNIAEQGILRVDESVSHFKA